MIDDGVASLDRHALVLSIWLALGFVATALFEYGIGAGGAAYTLAGFLVVIVAFVVHVIINAVLDTTFSPREFALGLVVYATGLLAFGAAVWLDPEFRVRQWVPVSLGFFAVFASVIFYLVTAYGVRRTFNEFDVIRDHRQ
jgi:hypothetical protein